MHAKRYRHNAFSTLQPSYPRSSMPGNDILAICSSLNWEDIRSRDIWLVSELIDCRLLWLASELIAVRASSMSPKSRGSEGGPLEICCE